MLNYMRRHARGTTIKILFWIIIIVFVLWGVGSFTDDDTLYAASVNGETISPRQVRRTAQQLERFYRELYRDNLTPEMVKALDFKNRALEHVINGALMRQEAARLGLSVSEEEIRDAIQAMPGLNANGRFQRETYFRYLRSQGITPPDFEAEERDRLLAWKIQDLITSSIRADENGARELYVFSNERVNLAFVRVKGSDLARDFTPTDAEIGKYYEEHRESFREPERVAIDYVAYDDRDFERRVQVADADIEQEYATFKVERYSEPEQVRARHILLSVPPEADQTKRDEIRKRAEAVLERLKKGEPFETVAEEVSEDTATKPKGGDLGLLPRGRTEEAFENAAFALEAGGLSDVVETRYGLHLIKVEDRKPAREKPLDEVRAEIEKALRVERAHDAARDAAFIDSQDAAGGKGFDEIAKARGLEVKSPAPFAETESVLGLTSPHEVVKAAFTTATGQVGPVTQSGASLVSFRVRDRQPTHVPELSAVRGRVEAAIRQEKGSAAARERAEAIRKLVVEKRSLESVAAAEKLTVEETGPFTRMGDYLPKLGSVPELKRHAFALSADDPVTPESYLVSGDGLVVFLKERLEADLAEFDTKKDDLVKRMVED
ncbi:MAG: SurA N-terminal domain-containing protein, partial [Candidatus Binatia bacterium]